MIKRNKIGIIIPCYYSSTQIYSCFQSIAQQTYKDRITVYMVNDCSPNTDCNYSDIINHFSQYFKIIYLQTLKNSGPGAASQLALDTMSLKDIDFIMFMDDDDYLGHSRVIENFIDILENKNQSKTIALIQGYRTIVNENNETIYDPNSADTFTGTLFNLQLIKNFNISFNVNLKFEEDSNFYIKYCYMLRRLHHLSEYNIIIYSLIDFNKQFSYIKVVNNFSITSISTDIEKKWNLFLAYGDICNLIINMPNDKITMSILEDDFSNLFQIIANLSLEFGQNINDILDLEMYKIINNNLILLIQKYNLYQLKNYNSNITLSQNISVELYLEKISQIYSCYNWDI